MEDSMTPALTLLVLVGAALLEAGGDALVRLGMDNSGRTLRVVLMALGGLVLFAYGFTVNVPRWHFGRLLGIYVPLLFVIAQVMAWVALREKPSPAILIGGGLIVTGGAVIWLWAR